MTNEFDFIDHPSVLFWLKEYGKTEPLGLSFLTQGNSDYFTYLWGTPNGETQKFSYWKRDYLGITIFVYSDSNSTFYKSQYLGEKDTFINDKKIGAYLIGFFISLVKEIIND